VGFVGSICTEFKGFLHQLPPAFLAIPEGNGYKK
jgi:hypothetical protein